MLKKFLLSSVLALNLSGCGLFTRSFEQNAQYSGPVPLSSEVAERFSYQSPGIGLSETNLVETSNSYFFTAELREFVFCDNGQERRVVFEYYQTKLCDMPPLVMVLPILGGDYAIESVMCETLAENGISTVLVHRPRGLQSYPSLEGMIHSLTTERRAVLDVVYSSGEVDVDRVGAFGISMGAITGVPLIAVDARLKYSLFGLGGGNIPAIIMESSEDSVEEFIEENLRLHGISRQQLLEHLQTNYHSDPLQLAPYVDARNVRMFLASFDSVVPTRYGLLLHEAIGRPELDMLPTGHYTSFLFYFWIKSLAVDFFQEKFGVDVEAVERAKIRIVRQAQSLRTRS